MPVTASPLNCMLQLKVQTGTDAKGNPVLVTRNYRSVKTAALDDAIYDVGLALAQLQEHPVDSIRRVNEMELESAI